MARILLVDSVPERRASVARALSSMGGHQLLQPEDEVAARGFLARRDVDLAVIVVGPGAVSIPGRVPEAVEGLVMAGRLLDAAPAPRPPVVFLAPAPADAQARVRALALGAADFVSYPVTDAELGARVGAVLTSKALADEQRRSASERELRHLQSEKLAAIGMLAAGVAHEINNPASYVVANAEALASLVRLMEDKLRNDPDAAKKLGLRELLFETMSIVQEMKDGLARIQRIVRDLHGFARVEDQGTAASSVNAAVESALTMLRNELRYRTVVERDLRARRLVAGNTARLTQVFLNLILNAAHALPESEIKKNRIRLRSFDEAGDVVVEVEDNGHGIDPAILPRIFDSFFTTKPPGLGTGLGLSISREMVRAAGGDISVETEIGKGALFRVRLPGVEGERIVSPEDLTPLPVELTPTPTPMPPFVGDRRRRRILAIDDEALLLKALRRMLIDFHDIEVALGGDEALRILAERPAFDLVLCDLQMPEMSGADVIRAVRTRWPGMEKRFIVMTGGAFSPDARRFLDEGTVATVNKPFGLEEILDIIDRKVGAQERNAG